MNEQEMAVKLAEVDARSKSNTHRLDEMDEKVDTLNRLATAVEVMATEQRHQTETMAEIKTDVTALGTKVDAIEKKPGKRWDGMVDKFLYPGQDRGPLWHHCGRPGGHQRDQK